MARFVKYKINKSFLKRLLSVASDELFRFIGKASGDKVRPLFVELLLLLLEVAVCGDGCCFFSSFSFDESTVIKADLAEKIGACCFSDKLEGGENADAEDE